MKPALTSIALAAAVAFVAVPAASAQAAPQQATSENWSGYVVGSDSQQQFRSASGSWVVPSVDCGSGDGSSSYWVGLGGSGQARSLEQAGTESTCANGSASYSAWYELVPSPPVTLDVAVHPGDTMSSTVTVDGGEVKIALSNQTTGRSFNTTLQISNPDVSSAEWIAEAPSSCRQDLSSCTPLPLANFGTVSFSNATATTTDGHTGTISDPSWAATAVTLSPSSSTLGLGGQQLASSQSAAGGATPSSLSTDGSAFSVAWSTGATATSAGSQGPGYPSSVGGYAVAPDGGYIVVPSGGYTVVPGSAYAVVPGSGYVVIPDYGYGASGYGGYGGWGV